MSIEGLGRPIALAAGKLLVLHEHEIPDLDEAVAVGVGAAGRAAGDRRPMVVEDLRARAARAGIPHRPEIVGARDANDLLVGKPRDLAPQRRRLIVVGEHGDEQAALVEREVLGEQLPGEQDRALLEIIAEGEIAEHLEEGVVAGGIADIVEVVVLAARAHAFLRRGRAQGFRLLGAGEHVLERHHAGIGEHQASDRGAARAAPRAPPRGRSWRRNRERPSGCRWCSSWQDGYGSRRRPGASSARLAACGLRLVSFAPLVLVEVMAALAGGLRVERNGALIDPSRFGQG